MVAGTRYRGDFEERLTTVLDEITAQDGALIVFIDELHTVVGAGGGGSEGSMDAGNILKPALARGELHIVGATTLDEYRKHIEKDAALERRFQPVPVGEPSPAMPSTILRGLRDRYESTTTCGITDEALVAAVELSDRYITDRFLPDKAIDLIDQAGARLRLRTRRGTTPMRCRAADRAARGGQGRGRRGRAVRARRRGSATRSPKVQARIDSGATASDDAEVPVVDTERSPRSSPGPPAIPVTPAHRGARRTGSGAWRSELHERVIGQDEAVAAVAEAVRRSRAGHGRPGPAGGQLPVPRADRGRQDRAGQGAGGGAVRRRAVG